MALEKMPYLMVPVEAKILRHICVRADASYKSFQDEFSQDRTSLIRYVQNLLQHQYIQKQAAIM